MNLEQITFRISIDSNDESTFVHFVDSGEPGYPSVKIGDLVMSVDEFESYVSQLNKIVSNLKHIGAFVRSIDV